MKLFGVRKVVRAAKSIVQVLYIHLVLQLPSNQGCLIPIPSGVSYKSLTAAGASFGGKLLHNTLSDVEASCASRRIPAWLEMWSIPTRICGEKTRDDEVRSTECLF